MINCQAESEEIIRTGRRYLERDRFEEFWAKWRQELPDDFRYEMDEMLDQLDNEKMSSKTKKRPK